jgi:DNA-binding MarR family transcriptional regulator
MIDVAMIAGSTIPAVPSTRGLDPSEEAAWRGFLKVHSALLRELDAELADHHRLSLSSYEVLVRLSEAPQRKLRMSDLAQSVAISPSGLTRMVDRLAGQGLVERDRCPGDARGTFAVLTDRGQERLREASATHLDGVRRLFLEQLSDEDQRRLSAFWERLLPV